MGVSMTHRINLSTWILIYSFSDTYYVWAACAEKRSCRRPASETGTFFMSRGRPHRASTVVIVMAATKKGNKRREGEVSSKRILVNGKMETKYKLKQRSWHVSACWQISLTGPHYSQTAIKQSPLRISQVTTSWRFTKMKPIMRQKLT